jgi:hypothetical protein
MDGRDGFNLEYMDADWEVYALEGGRQDARRHVLTGGFECRSGRGDTWVYQRAY